MSVMLETSAGEIVFDLYVDECPRACTNFLKLCKVKYYNGCLFFNVQRNFMVQSGDPSGTGRGGTSVFGLMYGEQARFFEDEVRPTLSFNKPGLLCMANSGPNTNSSQFFVTTRGDDLEFLQEKHTIFGEIAEGEDVLAAINGAYVDQKGRPYRDIRVLHTHVLEDPFDDPERLEVPDQSPQRFKPEEERVEERLGYDEKVDESEGRTAEEVDEDLKDKEAHSRAVVLEMIGDIPDAEIKPAENVLFVCQLNAVTEDEDLEIIFSRFGEIKCCEVIRDRRTGESLNYAFIEFATEAQCTEAYFKMNNVLIDDRRIKVDFSQSVSKMWNKWAVGKSRGSSGRGAARGAPRGERSSRPPAGPPSARSRASERPGDKNRREYRPPNPRQGGSSGGSYGHRDRTQRRRSRSRSPRRRSRSRSPPRNSRRPGRDWRGQDRDYRR